MAAMQSGGNVQWRKVSGKSVASIWQQFAPFHKFYPQKIPSHAERDGSTALQKGVCVFSTKNASRYRIQSSHWVPVKYPLVDFHFYFNISTLWKRALSLFPIRIAMENEQINFANKSGPFCRKKPAAPERTAREFASRFEDWQQLYRTKSGVFAFLVVAFFFSLIFIALLFAFVFAGSRFRFVGDNGREHFNAILTSVVTWLKATHTNGQIDRQISTQCKWISNCSRTKERATNERAARQRQ